VVRAGPARASAGADLNWMRGASPRPARHQNRADSERLALLMRTLNFLSKPTIARERRGLRRRRRPDRVLRHRHAPPTTPFGLTEVRLGLVPAVISPYVVAAIGARHARRLFVTGEIFDAQEAARIGLVHTTAPATELDAAVERALDALGRERSRTREQNCSPAHGRHDRARVRERLDVDNAALIARLRVSAEARGLERVLDKRHAAVERRREPCSTMSAFLLRTLCAVARSMSQRWRRSASAW
jgi:methylglutaconyl-CoA hydratase